MKFHFRCEQGIACYTDGEAADVVADDRESSQRDLFNHIANEEFPCWTLKVQIMPEADARTYHINPFDLTKIWPHGDCPLIEVGVLELNKNPENYEPNSHGQWKETPEAGEPPLALDGQPAARWNHRVDKDYHSQPGALFRLMPEDAKQRLFANIGPHMNGTPEEIQRRQLEHFRRADPAYAAGVAKALGLGHA